ncbi:winged helix-turn-helix domain-containing protein [Patescibacteria group bacterium]|nr:winged helix-turn-helix domain-containing protein [Patescibacteria group bacterium]
MKTSSYKRLERVVRGFSNHRRIQMLFSLKEHPELSVGEIAEKLKINLKTAAAHVQKLAIAGLVLKRNEGSVVRHKITARAENILKFLRIIELT